MIQIKKEEQQWTQNIFMNGYLKVGNLVIRKRSSASSAPLDLNHQSSPWSISAVMNPPVCKQYYTQTPLL